MAAAKASGCAGWQKKQVARYGLLIAVADGAAAEVRAAADASKLLLLP